MSSFRVPSTTSLQDLSAWLEVAAPLDAGSAVRIAADDPDPISVAVLACLRARHEDRVECTPPLLAALEALPPIVDLRAARREADRLAEAFEQRLPSAPASVGRAIRFVLEELGANIVQHSARPETGFLAIRPHNDPAPGRFTLTACDAGIGILGSMLRSAELAGRVESAAEAIQLAVERGLSAVGGRSNMGMGLGLLADLSDRLGAALWIASGDAVWFRRTVSAGHRVSTIRATAGWNGVWIVLDAPAAPA